MDDARPTRRLLLSLLLAGAAAPALASEPFTPRPRASRNFPDIPYATWREDEPAYRFFPGDEIEIAVPSAPELNRQVVVGPDGRITLPLIGGIMAADRTSDELQAQITGAYSSELLRPEAIVALRQAQPLRVYVGGEVANPGVFDMPGDLDAFRAVMMAGGFRNTAKRDQVVIIRRGREGRPMLRTVNLLRAFSDPDGADLVPLRRFDIVYVPRTRVAEVGLFVQQYLRDVLPVQFSYAFGNGSIN
jgi:polysaccharide export outer membrane protein